MKLSKNDSDEIALAIDTWLRSGISGEIATYDSFFDEDFQFSGPRKKIYLRIQESGSGIPKETHLNIFPPFFTTKPIGLRREFELSLSYEVVKLNGKELTLKSALGKEAPFLNTQPIQENADGKN